MITRRICLLNNVERRTLRLFNIQRPKPGHKHGGCNWRAEIGMDGDPATGTGVLEPEQVIIIQKLATSPLYSIPGLTKLPTSALGSGMLRESHKKKFESERAINSDTKNR